MVGCMAMIELPKWSDKNVVQRQTYVSSCWHTCASPFGAFPVDQTKILTEKAQEGDVWNKEGDGKRNGHDGEIPRRHNKAVNIFIVLSFYTVWPLATLPNVSESWYL